MPQNSIDGEVAVSTDYFQSGWQTPHCTAISLKIRVFMYLKARPSFNVAGQLLGWSTVPWINGAADDPTVALTAAGENSAYNHACLEMLDNLT